MDAYIVDGVRSAIGNFGGSLSGIRADDLAAHVIKQLIEKNSQIPISMIDEVWLGCANQAGEDNRNIARMATLLAGLPITVSAQTINILCASGLSAVAQAYRTIATNDAHLIIAGGIEHMSRAPYVISKASKAFGTDQTMYDSSFGWRFINKNMQSMYGTEAMGQTAENLAEMFQISRYDQDAFATWSQQKAKNAQESGVLANEIIPISISKGKNDRILFENDEFIKPNTTIEGLSGLKAAFKTDGSVTAGNASGLNDGAAALLIGSEHALKTYQLKPLARIVASASAGVEPRIMGIGPVEATKKVLKKTGLSLDQIDIIELNEAFAAQCLAVTRSWKIDDNDERLNPNGGAIALGHPLGMSGARITLSAALQLQASNKKYALCTMCIGVGQGFAVILERA